MQVYVKSHEQTHGLAEGKRIHAILNPWMKEMKANPSSQARRDFMEMLQKHGAPGRTLRPWAADQSPARTRRTPRRRGSAMRHDMPPGLPSDGWAPK